MRVLLILIVLLTAMSPFSFAERKASEGKVSCELKPLKEVYKWGEAVRFKFIVKNNSSKDMLFVKVLDGSGRGRFPSAKLKMTGPDGKHVDQLNASCGNSNSLTTADFVLIKAGEEKELSGYGVSFWSGNSKQGGKHKVKFTYSSMNDDIRKWIGGPFAPEGEVKMIKDFSDLFKKRQKITLTAEAEFEVNK